MLKVEDLPVPGDVSLVLTEVSFSGTNFNAPGLRYRVGPSAAPISSEEESKMRACCSSLAPAAGVTIAAAAEEEYNEDDDD